MAADATPAPVVAMIFEFWFDPEAPHIFEEYLRESDVVRRRLAEYEGFSDSSRTRRPSSGGEPPRSTDTCSCSVATASSPATDFAWPT
jgi:hypothetical protein